MQKSSTAIVTGNFNVLHPGHIRLFKFARSVADRLVVGIYCDELAGNEIDAPEQLRLESVESVECVDRAVLIDKSLDHFLKNQHPDFVVKGKEYENLHNEEEKLLEQLGAKLIFSSGEIAIPTTLHKANKKILKPLKNKSVLSFMKRHHITASDLIEITTKMQGKRVCIIGDLIVDEYVDCFPLGMSQEEPTLVVSPQEIEKFIGGAGIVASHASQLGAHSILISVTGEDTLKTWVAKELGRFGVEYKFQTDHSRPTSKKQRFRSNQKTLLKVSSLSQQAISNAHQHAILKTFEKLRTNLDILVFSDFNYGCLPQKLVDSLIRLANEAEIFVAADSQSSSQVGDISRFKGVDLITPTEREARIALRNYDDGLVVLAKNLLAETNSDNIILKLGQDGLIAQGSKAGSPVQHIDRIEALNDSPVDVSGAGDSLLITSALAMSSGATLAEASLLGSLAAFVQVGRKGNIPLKPSELRGVLPC